MASEPIITVGIPVYNEGKFLSETIDSILSQTLQNFTIIIADNCSTDDSLAIAKKYSENDNRIKIYRHENNIGIPSNFHFILTKAVTKYFVWLGAHDKFTPDYLMTGVEYLERNNNVLMVYPQAIWIDYQNNPIAEINEDICTFNLNKKKALIKILKNTDSGVAIHGIYRSDMLKSIPFTMRIGGETLIFFLTALKGEIARLNILGLYFRVMRSETMIERIKRYREIQILDSFLSYSVKSIGMYCRYTWGNLSISFLDKIIILFNVLLKFSKLMFWVTYRRILTGKRIRTVKTSVNR